MKKTTKDCAVPTVKETKIEIKTAVAALLSSTSIVGLLTGFLEDKDGKDGNHGHGEKFDWSKWDDSLDWWHGSDKRFPNVIIGTPKPDKLNGTGKSDLIIALQSDDVVNGGGGHDVIFAGQGNDIVNGDDGHDWIRGGQGNDTLNGGNGNDTLRGNEGDDQIWGKAGNDFIRGGKGDDHLIGGDGNDTLRGGQGNDTLWGSSGNDLIFGGKGDDRVIGGDGNDEIHGGAGDDTLWGAAGNDIVHGDAGRDTLAGGDGRDTLIGGADNDIYLVDSTTDKIVEDKDGGYDTINSSVSFDLRKLENVENLTLRGTANLNGTGNDERNRLHGNAGKNLLLGNGGDDQINGDAGNDTIDGGAGIDTFDLSTATGPVMMQIVQSGSNTVIDLHHVGLGVDTYRNMEGIIGSDYNDTLLGSAFSDELRGGDGDDLIQGNDGADTMEGNGGSDTLIGGEGNDVYVVSDTTDTIVEVTGGGYDTVNSSVSFDLLTAKFVENLTLRGDENIDGAGSNSRNRITGNEGNNVLDGRDGDDSIWGNDGNDTLIGGNGNDTMEGGRGHDELDMDAGKDTAVYSSALDGGDLLCGFSTDGASQDRVNLDALFDGLDGGVASGDRSGRLSFAQGGDGLELWLDAGCGGCKLLTFSGMTGSTGLSIGAGANDDIFVGTL
jgi:Ca2+-binding RTX toxin-like protein